MAKRKPARNRKTGQFTKTKRRNTKPKQPRDAQGRFKGPERAGRDLSDALRVA